MLLNDPSSSILQAKVKDYRRSANFLLEAERLFYQQKLKNKHLLLADRGTSYFHSLVKKKNFNSTIPYLLKSYGSYTITFTG